MSQTKTATVEALTAEVRVLMVGSRQITLSVYRQLDEYEIYTGALDGFEPFGRVSSGTKYDGVDYRGEDITAEANVEFVGRRKTTGALERLVVRAGDLSSRHGIDDEETKALIIEWRDTLPLIVLAGLR